MPSRVTSRRIEISAYFAYWPSSVVSLLSKSNSTDADPIGLRELDPLKITSVMESPRRRLAELSPITHRTASMTFDLPHPFGPTTPTRLLGKVIVVGSTKDLKPASLILLNRMGDVGQYPVKVGKCNVIFTIKRLSPKKDNAHGRPVPVRRPAIRQGPNIAAKITLPCRRKPCIIPAFSFPGRSQKCP